MDFPKFEDFSATLNNGAYKEITEAINDSKIAIKGSGAADIVKSAANAATTASIITTLELLRRYHEWLSEQLGK